MSYGGLWGVKPQRLVWGAGGGCPAQHPEPHVSSSPTSGGFCPPRPDLSPGSGAGTSAREAPGWGEHRPKGPSSKSREAKEGARVGSLSEEGPRLRSCRDAPWWESRRHQPQLFRCRRAVTLCRPRVGQEVKTDPGEKNWAPAQSCPAAGGVKPGTGSPAAGNDTNTCCPSATQNSSFLASVHCTARTQQTLCTGPHGSSSPRKAGRWEAAQLAECWDAPDRDTLVNSLFLQECEQEQSGNQTV